MRTKRKLELPDAKAFDEVLARLGQAGGVHHDGVHPAAAQPVPRPEVRPARRADHPRRGPHLRHGRAVQGVRHLRVAGPAVRARRPRPAALLHGEPGRPDPRGGHHRGRLDGQLHRRRHRATPPRACRWCRSSPSTRCSASSGWATSSGRPPTPGPAGSCSAPPPGAPRCSARASSTRTATASCWRRSNPVTEAYDPAFAYEVATIVAARPPPHVRATSEDVIYYLTLYNENHVMPADARRRRRGRHRGPLPLGGRARRRRRTAPRSSSPAPPTSPPARPRRELAEHYDVAAELWSATSYKRLREQALTTERWNRLHPDERPATPRVTELLAGEGPIVAVTDFMKAVPDQIARWVPRGPPLHAARHRRLRAQRHPRGAAPPLRDRRRPRRRRHPRGPRRRRAT